MISYSPDASTNYSINTIATYICNEGYYLEITDNNIEMRVCEDDNDNNAEGVWSGQPPTCVRELHNLKLAAKIDYTTVCVQHYSY